MTFTEAALEVLRSAGEPLHYKKITELAIERNLLSHVGKTPEVTMSSRLAMMVKKDRGQAPIIKVKPGVFAIRESALQELSPAALAAISEVEELDESATPLEAAVVEEIKSPALPGGDVFPEEEGDDDPILAGLEQETDSADRAGRRRRRRRRRGKGDKAEVGTEAPRVEPAREAPRERAREPVRESSRERDRRGADRARGEDRARSDERSRDDRGRHDSARRDSVRSDSGRNDSPRNDGRNNDDRARRDSVRNEPAHSDDVNALDFNRQPGDGDLLGKDLADAVALVLARGDRAPHSFARIAELLVRRGRLSGSPAALAPTIAAAVRADISRAELTQSRPRFRARSGRVSLSEWLLPKTLVRAEQDLLASAERHQSELRRALIQKLSELPTAGFAELLATWLNAEGVTALRAVRRPGSSGSELHFAGTRKIGSEEVRLAIVVQRGGRDIDREAVTDVRGALHHYGQATSGWLVTTGRIMSGAREEAAAQAAPCALFDGLALATAMERLGIAVRRYVIAHQELDYDLLEALGDSAEQRERRERELDRERRQYSERQAGGRSNEQRVARQPSHDAPKAEARDLGDALGDAEDADDAAEQARTLVPVKGRAEDWEESADDLKDEVESVELDEELLIRREESDEDEPLSDELENSDDDDFEPASDDDDDDEDDEAVAHDEEHGDDLEDDGDGDSDSEESDDDADADEEEDQDHAEPGEAATRKRS
jgi:hypothetical protein